MHQCGGGGGDSVGGGGGGSGGGCGGVDGLTSHTGILLCRFVDLIHLINTSIIITLIDCINIIILILI